MREKALPVRVSWIRQRCAACGRERLAAEPRVIRDGEPFCVGCDQALQAAKRGGIALTPEARAFVVRVKAKPSPEETRDG